MLIKKEQITIREFTIDDVENKVRWINDSENNEYLHYDIPLNVEKTKRWFLQKNNDGRLDCVIEFDSVPVGLIGLLAIDKQNSKAEFYISMGEASYKRKGIAYRATKMIIEYAFEDLGLNKIYLNVDAENIPACKLYEKSGFICEGVFKKDLFHRGKLIDRKRYAILREDL